MAGQGYVLSYTQPLQTNSQQLQLPAQGPHKQACRPSISWGHLVWYGSGGNGEEAEESDDGVSKAQGPLQSAVSVDSL